MGSGASIIRKNGAAGFSFLDFDFGICYFTSEQKNGNVRRKAEQKKVIV
jgi:hypothetical protein